MNSQEYRYSLCLSYPGKYGHLLSYRIADYSPDTKTFVQADYTEKYGDNYYDESDYEPLIIGANSETLKKNQVEIRNWKPKTEDPTKQWSYEYNDEQVYEIYFADEFQSKRKHTDEEIRKILFSGIIIPEEITDTFFLVINREEDLITVLKCKKSDFEIISKSALYYISDTVQDMLHTTHYWDKYIISRKDIISTKKFREVLEFEAVDHERYFFNKTVLFDPADQFFIRNAESYMVPFLRYYLKMNREKYQLTRSDTKHLIEVLENIIKADDEIDTFFQMYGLNQEIIKKGTYDNIELAVKTISDSGEMDEILVNCILKNEKTYNQCINTARSLWLQEHDDMRTKKEQEIVSLEKKTQSKFEELSEISENLSKKTNEIQEKKKSLSLLEEEIEDAETRKQEINDKIKQRLLSFKQDIVSATEMIGIAETVKNGQQPPSGIRHGNSVYCSNAVLFETDNAENDQVDDIVEFTEDFENNLGTLFDNNFKYELAALIVSAFAVHKAVVVPETSGRQTADLFSMLLDASTAFYICTAEGSKNITEIITKINDCNVRTVFIDGIINTYDETALTVISRNCNGKYLFFGSGCSEIVRSWSANLWENTIYLNLNEFIALPANGIPTKARCESIPQLLSSCNKKELKDCYKQLKPYRDCGLLNPKVMLDFSSFLSVYYELVSEDDEAKLPLLSVLYFICQKSNEALNEFEKKLKECGFDAKSIESLRRF